jgi:hypothetical protein
MGDRINSALTALVVAVGEATAIGNELEPWDVVFFPRVT